MGLTVVSFGGKGGDAFCYGGYAVFGGEVHNVGIGQGIAYFTCTAGGELIAYRDVFAHTEDCAHIGELYAGRGLAHSNLDAALYTVVGSCGDGGSAGLPAGDDAVCIDAGDGRFAGFILDGTGSAFIKYRGNLHLLSDADGAIRSTALGGEKGRSNLKLEAGRGRDHLDFTHGGVAVVGRCGDFHGTIAVGIGECFADGDNLTLCIHGGNCVIRGGEGDCACTAFAHGIGQYTVFVHAEHQVIKVKGDTGGGGLDFKGYGFFLVIVSFDGDNHLAGINCSQQAVRSDGGNGFIRRGEGGRTCTAGGEFVAQLDGFTCAQGSAATGKAYAGGGLFYLNGNFAACAGSGSDGDDGVAHLLAGDHAFGVYTGDGRGFAGICNFILCAFRQQSVACDAGAFLHAQYNAGTGGNNLFGGDGAGEGHHHDRGFICDEDGGQVAVRFHKGHAGGYDFGENFGYRGFKVETGSIVNVQLFAPGFSGLGDDGCQGFAAFHGQIAFGTDEIVVLCGGTGRNLAVPHMIQGHSGVGQAEVQAGFFGGIVHGGVDVGPFAVQLCNVPGYGRIICIGDYDALHACGSHQLFQCAGIAQAVGTAFDEGGIGAVCIAGCNVGQKGSIEPEGAFVVGRRVCFAHGTDPEGNSFAKLELLLGSQFLGRQRGLGGGFDRRLHRGVNRRFRRRLNGRLHRRLCSGFLGRLGGRFCRCFFRGLYLGYFRRCLRGHFSRKLGGCLSGNLRGFFGGNHGGIRRRCQHRFFGGDCRRNFGGNFRGGLRLFCRDDIRNYKICIIIRKYGHAGCDEYQAQQGAQTTHKEFFHLFKPPKWHTSP